MTTNKLITLLLMMMASSVAQLCASPCARLFLQMMELLTTNRSMMMGRSVALHDTSCAGSQLERPRSNSSSRWIPRRAHRPHSRARNQGCALQAGNQAIRHRVHGYCRATMESCVLELTVLICRIMKNQERSYASLPRATNSE
eukprot:COSAG01_NODE_235_length_20918_cov_41.045086_2_plen_143_part_00